MSRSYEELLAAVGVTAAHEVSLRSLRRSSPGSDHVAFLQSTPAATYIASSATNEIGVDFAECMKLLGRGAKVTGSIVGRILEKRRD